MYYLKTKKFKENKKELDNALAILRILKILTLASLTFLLIVINL